MVTAGFRDSQENLKLFNPCGRVDAFARLTDLMPMKAYTGQHSCIVEVSAANSQTTSMQA